MVLAGVSIRMGSGSILCGLVTKVSLAGLGSEPGTAKSPGQAEALSVTLAGSFGFALTVIHSVLLRLQARGPGGRGWTPPQRLSFGYRSSGAGGIRTLVSGGAQDEHSSPDRSNSAPIVSPGSIDVFGGPPVGSCRPRVRYYGDGTRTQLSDGGHASLGHFTSV